MPSPNRLFKLVLIALVSFVPVMLTAQTDYSIESRADIVYAEVDGQQLMLDLYTPGGVENPALLLWVHGGAWRSMTRKSRPTESIVNAFVPAGYAVASVEFRQSTEAMFPAQIHDIKAAIRFLRARQDQLGVNAEKIVAMGNSSGGHLVAVLAVSNRAAGLPELQGSLGSYANESSDVQGVVSYYGGSNLTTILSQSTPHGLSVREPALDLLLGGQPDDKVALAELASPVLHVNDQAVPLLLLHGDQDPQMPINQAHELQGAYESQGRDVELVVIHGAAHGGPLFHDRERNAIVLDFVRRILGK